jgi:hypothetical protein
LADSRGLQWGGSWGRRGGGWGIGVDVHGGVGEEVSCVPLSCGP